MSSSTWPVSFAGTGVLIVLNVQPADAGLHGLVLLVGFGSAEPLADDVGAVEDGHQRGMIDLAVQFGHQLAGLADEVGFDFQPKGEIAAVAHLGNPRPTGRPPGGGAPGIGPFGW